YSVTIDNCIASNNITASGSNCYGFQLAGCSACWLKNCTASRNSGASTINAGFRLQTNSSGCRFSNCAAFDQRDGSINCGFYFEQGVSNSIIENSHAYAQSAGAAAGIRFAYSAPTAVTNCVVRNCLLYDNVGTSASYGFYDEAAVSSTILAHNTAYGHGASNPGPGNPSNGSFTNYRVTYEQDTTPHASSNLITEKILTDIGTINATGILGEFQNLSIIS
ncbi:MAG TPA: right-handed parallel beta-helix repeat-containing protein, partial [Candidatus Babeliales bacterium]|nr:right-handed parallel beta-helix repeat-containing protein [Candidatus Babeliales bacterium]